MCRLARSHGKKGSWQQGQNESGPEHLACPSASALGRRSFVAPVFEQPFCCLFVLCVRGPLGKHFREVLQGDGEVHRGGPRGEEGGPNRVHNLVVEHLISTELDGLKQRFPGPGAARVPSASALGAKAVDPEKP